MELYQLRSFVTVAHEGHLTRAAKRLYISQPAVSAHIKSLEEELGVALFTRTPQGMQLTKEGQVLRIQAEKSLSTVNELFQQAKSLQDDLAEVMKIGLNTDPSFLKIGDFFSVMTENYPKLEFHLLQRFSWEVPDELRNGNLDAGYMYGSEVSPDIAVVPLQTCNVFIVGPVRWKAQLERADWKEIAEFPWIWPSDYCPFCQLIDEEFQQRNLEPCKVAVADQEPTLKTLVTSGVGLTLMIEDEALAAEQEGKLVAWKKDTLQIDLSFVYLKKRENDLVIQAILNGIFIVWDILDQCETSLTTKTRY
jgi:DNA-binding transcriptional LysR family regulator